MLKTSWLDIRNHRMRAVSGGVLAASLVALLGWWAYSRFQPEPGSTAVHAGLEQDKPPTERVRSEAKGELEEPHAMEVRLAEHQQRLIGLRTEKVVLGSAHDVLMAPGRVAPDETRYAQITPRAEGVIRTVNAVIGQEVHAGDVLATVDSPEVGKARLALYTLLQELEVARARADWQETVYDNALQLAKSLEMNMSPEEIHRRFEHKAIGENREKLMTAYTHFHLAEATFARKRDLFQQKIISEQTLQEVRAEYEVNLASYQTLMDQMEYQTKLDLTRARQALQQAETAVRVGREQLRILGVRAVEGGIEPTEIHAEITNRRPSSPNDRVPPSPPPATAPTAAATVTANVGPDATAAIPTLAPGTLNKVETQLDQEETPVSAYALRAPFDGTILDRETIVPGVFVDTTHRLFTIANLSSVWVEASVHESDFVELSDSRGGRVLFRSPAYPDREFTGEVTYTGDLVDEKSRTVKLLARADNPERLLKPGMFVEVKILNREARPAVQIPVTALLTEGDSTFVYIKTGPDRFIRRVIETDDAEGEKITVLTGLKPGEEVVVDGGYQIKAEALRLASSE